MPITLQQFVNEMHEDLLSFQQYWLKNNLRYPDRYPKQLEDKNEGLWLEMFLAYLDSPQPSITQTETDNT